MSGFIRLTQLVDPTHWQCAMAETDLSMTLRTSRAPALPRASTMTAMMMMMTAMAGGSG
ncbi:MAG: hypothetical protein ABR588_11265 [Sphingomicrobium sp.]